MKLKELIKELNKLEQEHGDMPVYYYDSYEEHTGRIQGRLYIDTAQKATEKFYDAGDSDLKMDIKNSLVSTNEKVLILR